MTLLDLILAGIAFVALMLGCVLAADAELLR